MNKKFGWGLISSALIAVVLVFSAGSGAGQIAEAKGPKKAKAEVAWDTDGNHINKKAFLGSTNNRPLVFKTNSIEQMRLLPNGNVGIGTASPTTKLDITGVNSILRLESSANNLWTITDYKADGREWHSGVGGSAVPNDLKNKYYIHDVSAGNTRMVIDTQGKVGFGTTSPGAPVDIASGRLRLSAPSGLGDIEFTEAADVIARATTENPDPAQDAFRVDFGSNLTHLFKVRGDGTVKIGALAGTSTQFACLTEDLTFAACEESAPSANPDDASAAQVRGLRRENDALKQQLTALEARTAALEGASNASK